MSKFTTIRLNAGHDSNGNPRRVFVTLAGGEMVATYNEGYSGDRAITNRYHRAAYTGLTYETTPGMYKQLIS